MTKKMWNDKSVIFDPIQNTIQLENRQPFPAWQAGDEIKNLFGIMDSHPGRTELPFYPGMNLDGEKR